MYCTMGNYHRWGIIHIPKSMCMCAISGMCSTGGMRAHVVCVDSCASQCAKLSPSFAPFHSRLGMRLIVVWLLCNPWSVVSKTFRGDGDNSIAVPMGYHNLERSKVISVVTWIDYVLRSLTWLFVAVIQDSRARKDVFPSVKMVVCTDLGTQ